MIKMAQGRNNQCTPRVHVLDVEPHYFLSKIISGEKKYEGRLATKVIEWNLKPGSVINFYSSDKEVKCIVTELRYFKDFGEAFNTLGYSLMPNMLT